MLELKKAALLQALEKEKQKGKYAAAASQTREVHGKARCHQSNRLLRRERERETRARSREQRLVARLLACQVSPSSGGTDMQASATPCTLQRWQEMGKSCAGVRQKRAEKSCIQAEPQDKRGVAMSNFR